MLDFSGSTIIWEIVNFLVITVALYFLVFKPIVKRSEERAAQKARLIQEMQSDRQEAAEKLEQINTRLANLDEEIEKITEDVYEKNKAMQVELLDSTRHEANIILQDALLEVHKEQLVDMKDHQQQLIDVILNISGKTIRRVVPPSLHASLIEGLTKQIWDLGKTGMRQVQTIRESLSEREPTAYITSAFPLTAEQEMNLVRTFSALADKEVNIHLETDEKLIAGIKVRLGDLIIENSMVSQLEEVREQIAESLAKVSMDNEWNK